MPVVSTNPIEIDGQVYPNFLINFSMSPLLTNGEVGQSVAIRFTPERIEDGVSYQAPEHAKTVNILDVYKEIANGDMIIGKAVLDIANALQDYVNGKGL